MADAISESDGSAKGARMAFEELIIRPFDRFADAEALLALDTSYVTDRRFEVQSTVDAVNLQLRRLPAKQYKRYTIDLNVPAWTEGVVAISGRVLRGFIATDFQAWNRRLAIWHFYVDAKHRHRGIGRRLMRQAIESGRQRGAELAWVETCNFNYPGVQVYQHLGFQICGFDLSLYECTSSKGEFALYLSSPIHTALRS